MRSLVRHLSAPYELPEPWEYAPPGGIRLMDVRTVEQLAEHADAWDDLLLRANVSTPMNSFAWVSAFFETQLAPTESWVCLLAYDGERLVGLLPLVVRKCYRVPFCRPALLRTPHNVYHTTNTDCLALPGREDILEVFVDYLDRVPGIVPFISIRTVAERSCSPTYAGRAERALNVMVTPKASISAVDLPGTREEYSASLSANFRRYLKKNTKKLNRHEDVSFHIRASGTWEANLGRLLDVEDRNWKGKDGTSIQAVEADKGLFTIATERLAERGWMVWNFLDADGKTIAGQYGMRVGRVLYLQKIGFDDDYQSCSPGSLLMARVIEDAIESGEFDVVDMMTECEWHSKWQVASTKTVDLLVFPKNAVFGALAKLGVLHKLNKLMNQ